MRDSETLHFHSETMAESSLKQETDIESSMLSLSLKESSANRRSAAAYAKPLTVADSSNPRYPALSDNPGSTVKSYYVRPPFRVCGRVPKNVSPPGSTVKPCSVSVRPVRPPIRVHTPGSTVKPCSVSERPPFRVCGRLPKNFTPPAHCSKGKCKQPVTSGKWCAEHKEKQNQKNLRFRAKRGAGAPPPSPPSPPPGPFHADGQCIWRCPNPAVDGHVFCVDHLPPMEGGEGDSDVIFGAGNLVLMSRGDR